MLLTGRFHLPQVCLVELMAFDRTPIVGRGIHRKTGGHGPVSTDNHVVLACPAIPAGKAQSSVLISSDARHTGQQLPGGSSSVAVPTNPMKVAAVGHPHEGFHFLETGDGVHHLVAGLVPCDQPVDQLVYGTPVFRMNVSGVIAKMLEVI